MTEAKLNQIAAIQSGYSFRGGFGNIPIGDVNLIQVKNLAGLRMDELLKIKFDNVDNLVRIGDVLLSCKGNFRALAITSDIHAVTPSSIITIRIVSDAILPEYLAIYLNSTRGQAQLRSIANGITIRGFFNKPQLAEVIIPIPELSRQKEIIKAANLTVDYATKSREKAELAERYASEVVDKLISKGAK